METGVYIPISHKRKYAKTITIVYTKHYLQLALNSLVTDNIYLILIHQDSPATLMVVVIQIVDIHGDDLSLIETLDVLEYRMTYIDSVHIVSLKNHIERIA